MNEVDTNKKNHPKVRKAFTIVGICFASFFTLIFLVWGGFNVFKFAIYGEYYSLRSQPASIPGLKDGFIPQGISYLGNDDSFALAGYMNDGSTSRIYTTDKDNNVKYFTLKSNGENFYGHTGGLTYVKIDDNTQKMYLASELYNNESTGGIYCFDASCLNQASGTSIELGNAIKVNNNSSFIYSDDVNVYVGEFNNNDYVCSHDVKIDENTTNHAIISKYSAKDTTFSNPLEIYSIKDEVQGCAVKGSTLILSTSYGLKDSHLYFYDLNNTKDSDKKIDNVAVKILNEPIRDIKGPCMFEDLDLNSDQTKLITAYECGSSRYVIGAFFFANKISEIKID